jgi:hypothetical protein
MANEKLFQPEVNKIEKDANVVVAFHGLMCFAHKRTALIPFCEVGIHNNAPGHSLEITVWEVDAGFDPPDKSVISDSKEIAFFERAETGSDPSNIISLTASNTRVPGVSYFQRGPVTAAQNDFRRVLDFEGSDFYDESIDSKNLDKFGPRVHINNGLFYSWFLTKKKFKRYDNVKRFGKINHIAAANIYLNDGGSAVLQVGDKTPVNMPFSHNKKYLIMIDNGCRSCNTIDFDDYYRAFTPPSMKPELHLAPDDDVTIREPARVKKDEKAAEEAKESFERFLREQKHVLSGDDSPCGSVAFGRSDGIS